MLKDFEDQLELMPDLNLKLKYIGEEIERIEKTSLDWIRKGADLKDKYLKAEFEGGQKYLEFLRKKEKYPNYKHQEIKLPPPAENPEQYNSVVNFKSWAEGRIAVIPQGVIVCTNFDELKTPAEFITMSILVLVPDTLSSADKHKIKRQQEENTNTHIDNEIDAMIMHFTRNASRVYDKIQFIEDEIKKYEKLFYEEKLSIKNKEAIREFKNENSDLAHIDIAEFRSIYFTNISKHLFPYAEQRSFNCLFRYHSEDLMLYKSTWAYVKFNHWLKKYKAAYNVFFVSISSEALPTLVREFTTLEKIMTDFTTKAKLQNILSLHHEFKKEKYNFSKNEDDFKGEIVDFFIDHYILELEILKNKIQSHFIQQVSEEKKSSVINYVFNQYQSLCRKSNKFQNMLPETIKEGHESIIIGRINIELYQFGVWFELTFKSYLDPALLFNNTDDNKIITHFLSSYSYQQAQLNNHKKHDCIHRELALKSLDRFYKKFTNDFHEQYDFIASKWIKQNSSKGNSANELDFVTIFLKRFENLFKYDIASKTYKAIDYEQTEYSFEKKFFISYMEKTFNFFQTFLKDRLKELNILVVSNPTKNRKNKYQRKNVITFTYSHWNKNAGAIKPLHRILIKKFIAKDTSYKDIKNIFSNELPSSKIVWLMGKGTLKYFVLQLKTEKKILKSKIWVAANNAFQIENEPDFNIRKLGNGKLPKHESKVLTELKTIVNSL